MLIILKKRIISVLTGLLLFFSIGGISHAVLFDFNSLPNGAQSIIIDSYMTGVYGSAIDISGAFVSTEADDLGADPHLANKDVCVPCPMANVIAIEFLAIPINAFSVEWEVKSNTTTYTDMVDFSWRAYDIYNNIIDAYVYDLGLGQASYSSTTGWITFSTDIYRLEFSDNKIHQIGIDNLEVRSIPEPITLLLLGTGLVLLFSITYITPSFLK